MTVFLTTAFAGKPLLLRPLRQGRFQGTNFRGKTGILPVTKTSKPALLPFPKVASVDTYAPHPMALPGLPSQEATGNASIGALALAGFASSPPEKPD